MHQPKKAKESRRIQRARKKLEAKLIEEHAQFTPEHLDEVSKTIRKLLKRHHPVMTSLKQKKIEPFDENAHTARVTSEFVKHLRKELH